MKQRAIKPLELGRHVKSVIAQASLLAEQGKHEEALRISRALHAQFPDRADVNDALALALLDVKKGGEALQYAKRAVDIEAGSQAYKVNLGLLYLDLGKAEDALPLLEAAARHRDCPPQALWALARYYFEVGKAELSLPYFEQAEAAAANSVELPDIQFDHLRNLASAGMIEAADALVKRLQKMPGSRVQATIFAASLRTDTVSSPAFSEMQDIVNSADVSSTLKSQALLQIGKMHDRSREYAEAFACFEGSKTLRGTDFNIAAFEHYIGKLTEVFTADLFNQFAHLGTATDVPVFVLGMPRSGTTLTEQIIAAHPEAAGIGEQKRMGSIARHLVPEADPARLLIALEKASNAAWHDVGEAYMRLVRHIEPAAKRVVDKMPHNFLYLGLIALCFPRAKFVHVHRNPLDNFISAFENNMSDFHSYSFNQVTYGKYYQLYRKLMEHWNKVLPGRILDWQYEQLVMSPEQRVRELLQFVELPWSEECLRFHEKKTTVKTLSLHQVRSPISAKSVGRWQNYKAELAPLRDMMGL